MDSKELRNLQEAYMEVVENQQLDEASPRITRSMGRRATQYRKDQEQAAHMERVRKHQEKMKNDPEYRANHERLTRVHSKKEEQKESFDLFDYLLEYLVTEGYADTNKAALAIMANMSEEWKQDIMEISQKTATKAYARSVTGEYEGQDSPRDVRRSDTLRRNIKRKFGDKAAKHADRAAHAMTFGRNSKFMKMPPKP